MHKRIQPLLSVMVAFLLFVLAPRGYAIGASWQTLAPLPVANATNIATTGRDSRIYVLQPYGEPGQIKATFLAYNIRTNTWSTLSNIPTPRFSPGLQVGLDGKIYAIGGHNGNSQSYNIIEAYDPRTNTWTCSLGDTAPGCTASTLTPAPTARGSISGSTATGLDGQIYVIGGTNADGYLNTVEAYNPKTNTWATLAPLNVPRDGRSVTGPNGNIYFMGGTGCVPGSGCTELNDVQIYNPRTNLWSAGAPMPLSRSQFALSLGFDGKLYATGGFHQTSPQPSYDVLASVDAYNPRTNTWSSAPALPFARAYPAGATGLDGRIYAIGGTLCVCNTFETTAQAFDTRP